MLLAAFLVPTAAQSDGLQVMQIAPTQTLPLSAAPGCGGDMLGPTMDTCMLEDTIKRGAVHEYTFVVPQRMSGKPFSVLVTAKSVGGHVDM
jgi:hypothetical protein